MAMSHFWSKFAFAYIHAVMQNYIINSVQLKIVNTFMETGEQFLQQWIQRS
jgi:hypothetical protein